MHVNTAVSMVSGNQVDGCISSQLKIDLALLTQEDFKYHVP